jgi:hypothetical protein
MSFMKFVSDIGYIWEGKKKKYKRLLIIPRMVV